MLKNVKKDTMKAIVCTKYGVPEVLKLKEIEKPIPKDNEVLINIFATTVISGDITLRKLTLLKYLVMAPIARIFFGVKNMRKKILGHDFVGKIEKIGESVKKHSVGDIVFGTTGYKGGAYAEFICLPEDGVLLTKPENISYQEAAAIPIGGMTALCFLKKGNIDSNQKVLIYGASGSIGTYAIQIAKYFGANVTGVCSSSNLNLVKSLGADKVIDYTKTDFTQQIEKYDLIFDTVGKCSSPQCKKVLNRKGIYLSTHSSPMSEKIEDLIFLKKMIKKGKLKSVIDRTYKMDEIIEAHKYVEKGHKKGNVIINIKE